MEQTTPATRKLEILKRSKHYPYVFYKKEKRVISFENRPDYYLCGYMLFWLRSDDFSSVDSHDVRRATKAEILEARLKGDI